MYLESINPATGELIEKYPVDTDQIVEQKIQNAADRFASWSRTSVEQRSVLLKNAAGILRANEDSFARLMTMEMGKPVTQAKAEVKKCALVCEYYAQNAGDFLKISPRRADAAESFVRYDPLGVVLAVMPWNFPFWQVFRFASASLAAGNTALLKHSSCVSGCSLAIERIFKEAGVPEGIFTSLLVGSSAVEKIIADPRIAAVSLTGSETAGSSVGLNAGRELKKCVLELGGSDPFIVLADADIAKAAKTAATARTLNSGQSCIAAKRFIVQKEIADEFTHLFIKSMSELKMGDPLDPATELGPQAREDLRNELHGQVERSIRAGAVLNLGGVIPPGKGYFYPATVLTSVHPGMPVCDEETFGPVAPVIIAGDAMEAVSAANHSQYGLGASLWTKDLEKAKDIASRLETGCVFINDFVKSDPGLPFGGVKKSGFGRELGEEGIREFVNIKTVVVGK